MTRSQNIRYYNLIEAVKNGKITMNQSFNEAKKGFLNANGDSENGFGGNFKDWITHAQNEGWIDQALGTISTILSQRRPPQSSYTPPPPPPKNNTNTILIAGGIFVVAVVGIAVIYKLSKS